MQAATPISLLSSPAIRRSLARTALLASPDLHFRQRLNTKLTSLRWQVHEAENGAQAWSEAELIRPDVVILDTWLPDLEMTEFVHEFRASFPKVDMLSSDGTSADNGPRSPYRQELLFALRSLQDTDTAAWNTAFDARTSSSALVVESKKPPMSVRPGSQAKEGITVGTETAGLFHAEIVAPKRDTTERLPELVGESASMLEISRRIRLVAPRSTPVLIEGPTGSGKEIVAEALHRLSSRSRKPFIAINCAAIPEALLEAELFGHTRGAFTGAVQGRVGRIEAADGGTLFLDEIGEMPLSLQSKLLRFVECGELQRVGDNETVKVDVRVIAATHRPLAKHASEGLFRSDLYYRLAVFLIRTPALADHMEDLPLLVQHFLERMGRREPVKQIDGNVLAKLAEHTWPGNVRELEHVLERAAILAGDAAQITAREIDFGLLVN